MKINKTCSKKVCYGDIVQKKNGVVYDEKNNIDMF